MSRVIDFKTRQVITEEGVVDSIDTPLQAQLVGTLTSLELFNKLFEVALTDIDHWVVEFKKQGKWNPVAEKLVQRIVQDTRALCASIAGEQSHGS